jgi:hypothetical protein
VGNQSPIARELSHFYPLYLPSTDIILFIIIIMAYSRWQESIWYVFWDGQESYGHTRSGQVVNVNCDRLITYPMAKEHYRWELIQKLYGCTEEEAKELRHVLDMFVADIEANFEL